MTWSEGVYAAWALVIASGIALWGVSASRRTVAGARVARPGSLVRRLMRHPALRVAVLLVWMWVGWHLFAR